MQCYNCEKFGHMAKDCWYNKGKGVAKDNDDDDEAKMAQEDSDGEPRVFMVAVSEDCYFDSETLFLDTGCSIHMIGHKTWLIKFDDTRRSNIRLVDSRSMQAEEA